MKTTAATFLTLADLRKLSDAEAEHITAERFDPSTVEGKLLCWLASGEVCSPWYCCNLRAAGAYVEQRWIDHFVVDTRRANSWAINVAQKIQTLGGTVETKDWNDMRS
jgi:hypothetical protein